MIEAKVTQVTPLTPLILRVELTPTQYRPYEAGQYLKIVTEHEESYFSIANAPLGAKTYELHIKHYPNHPEQQHIIDLLSTQGIVKLDLPFGQCTLKKLDSTKPIIFIAAGTGFAPIKAMIEQLLFNGHEEEIHLFWAASTKQALYLEEQVLSWTRHIPKFKYTAHVSKAHNTALAERILPVSRGAQIVLAGPFAFVYAIRDKLIAHGIKQSNLFSDAFDFEKK